MRNRNVLICSPSFALRGGVETIINDLSRELPKRGWDVTLGLGKGLHFNDVDAYRSAYPDLPIREIDGTKGTRQGRLEGLASLLESARPDVVLSARIFDAYYVVTEYKKRRPNLRLAVTIQAYEPHYLYDARIYRDTLDLCVTSGNLIRSAVVEWANVPSDRVVSIPGGVSAPRVPVSPRTPRSPIRIGYVGRIEQDQKRIFDAVTFLGELDTKGIDYTFDVIGTGPAEKELLGMLMPWINQGRVKFHGWQSKDQLYLEFLPNMDCLIHFAHTEGVTIAPREAMAHGVVPVISQFTGLKTEQQFVHEWNSLTFPIGDMESAAANITRLISEPGLLQRLSGNAQMSQAGKYSFDGSMAAWAEAFDQCLERPPAMGATPQVEVSADGRLTRMGLSAKAAQRVRDLFGVRYSHSDPGSEWPTGSGLMTEQAEREIWRFASESETRSDLGNADEPRQPSNQPIHFHS